MTKQKKPYAKPQLTNYGDVEKLTQGGGGNFIDVPFGTPNAGSIEDITGPV